MSQQKPKPEPQTQLQDDSQLPSGTNRRRFLANSAKAAAVATTLGTAACFPDLGGRWPETLAACKKAYSGQPLEGSAPVVEVFREDSVIEDKETVIDPEVVAEMLQQIVATLAGTSVDPWSVLFPQATPATRIGLKVNCLNEQCPTSVPLVKALVDQLKQGLGVVGENIIVWDRRLDEMTRCGYSEETLGARVVGTVNSTTDNGGPGYEADYCTVVSGKTTRLSKIVTRLTDVTINCPVLKTHGVSGVTAALKNVYGVIDNPGDFHSDLNQALPKIYALDPIRKAFVLTVCDALIAVTLRGTSSPPDTVPRRLFISQDPLALDRYALDLVHRLRAERNQGPIKAEVTQWMDLATDLGIGARNFELLTP